MHRIGINHMPADRELIGSQGARPRQRQRGRGVSTTTLTNVFLVFRTRGNCCMDLRHLAEGPWPILPG